MRLQVILIIPVTSLAVVGDAVAIYVARNPAVLRAGIGEDAVRPGRRQLQNRRYLEAPRNVKHAGYDEAVAFIGVRVPKILRRIKSFEGVLRLVAEIRRLSEPGQSPRQRVMSVQLK